MVKSKDAMAPELREHMRGGDGTVEVTDIVKPGEFKGKARMIAKVVLKPGCSIGRHVHENEEEIFYLLSGEATLDDNGETKLLHAGDASITLGGEGHSIANNGDKDVELMAIVLTY